MRTCSIPIAADPETCVVHGSWCYTHNDTVCRGCECHATHCQCDEDEEGEPEDEDWKEGYERWPVT